MSDDPAVRAAIDAIGGHLLGGPLDNERCTCGEWAALGHEQTWEEHELTVAVEAARPIIEAEYQNRMVELTKAPITAADLSELAINDLTDADNGEPERCKVVPGCRREPNHVGWCVNSDGNAMHVPPD